MTDLPIFRQDLLAKVFDGDLTLVSAFQQLVRYVTEAADNASAGASVANTVSTASLLTLSPVSGWAGARVLTQGTGVSLTDDGSRVTVSLDSLTPKIDGGFPVTFLVTADTNLILPVIGTVATLADIQAAISTGTVTSFNTRVGAVTLTSGDVTGALGFTPYNATNPAGYISGITSGMVTTALGYTPTSITGFTGAQTPAQITAALNVFSSTLKGLAPLSGGGTTNFLRADGTWAAPPGATSGTVTSVSGVTANGVSFSIANPTTTPAITITLGAITPSSVAATGTVSGSNLSGTNTGDQTSVTGNAGTATKWLTARTLGITGDLVWTSPSLDGSANVTAAGTLATVNSNVGSFGSATQVATFTVNGKGLTTAAANVTITPAVGSITGLGTGVATALALNIGSAGAFVTFNGAGGTPSSLTLTNATGLPTAGLVNNAVTFAKLVAASAASIVGATAAGNFAELTPSSARTVLGLGTAALVNTGTSGATIPLLNGGNTFSAANNFTATVGIGAATPLTDLDIRGHAGLFKTVGSDGANIYLGDANFANANYVKAGGIGAVFNAAVGVACDLGLFIYNGAARTEIARVVYNSGIEPAVDNTYYLGKNSSTSPKAWKGVILKDTASGTYYRVQITSGALTIVSL